MKHTLALAALLVPLASFADSFDGCYVGLYAGHAWGEDKGISHDQATGAKNGWEQKTYPTGIQYGVLTGYNWHLENNLVLGVEGDYEGRADDSDRDYQELNGVTDTDYSATSKITAATSLRGRLGYLLNAQTLVYTTAGYAAADIKRKWHDDFNATAESHSDWQDGWTAGVGAEYLLSDRISTRLEYRYSDYGTEKVAVNMWNERYKQSLTDQSLSAGVAYQF